MEQKPYMAILAGCSGFSHTGGTVWNKWSKKGLYTLLYNKSHKKVEEVQYDHADI